jgi:hypothetical protein
VFTQRRAKRFRDFVVEREILARGSDCRRLDEGA